MSSLEYYNNLVGMNEVFYESHKRLIERICIELDVVDRVDDLIEKYLDNKFKLKAKRDPNKPKRNCNAYTHFCKEYREMFTTGEKLSFSEMNKKLGETWNSLEETNKKKFHDIAAKDKDRFQNELEKYNESMGLCSF